MIKNLVEIQYNRNDMDFRRGTFRVKGDIVDIFPASEGEQAYRIQFFGDEIEEIQLIDALTGKGKAKLEHCMVFPATPLRYSYGENEDCLQNILEELDERVAYFKE